MLCSLSNNYAIPRGARSPAMNGKPDFDGMVREIGSGIQAEGFPSIPRQSKAENTIIFFPHDEGAR